ncbi:MAG: two-partner secretion domain-containing protein [Planctomycetota bacterium]
MAGSASSLDPESALANPVVEQIVSGTVNISESGTTMTVEASNQSIIDWHTFDVGSLETVDFVQPDSASTVLNRITGGLGPSQIDGTVTGNGTLLFVNPAGFVFGANSVVDAGGFLAAAADLNNDFFNLSDVDQLSGISGQIVVEGMITADAITLVASSIANHGQVIADNGVVTMYTANGVLVREGGESRIYTRLESPTQTAARLASQGGDDSCDCDSGLRTLGAGDAYSLGILNTGTIQASGGTINLIANNGGFRNEGTIDTSITTGRAGNINVLAREITNSGTMRADSNTGRAGAINLSSTTDITLECNSVLSASGLDGSGRGGKVFLLAQGDIEFYKTATIDVSGGASGAGGLAIMNSGGNIDIGGEIVLDGSSLGRLFLFEGTPGIDDNLTNPHCDPTPPPPPTDDADLLAGARPDEIPFSDSVRLDSYNMDTLGRLAILAKEPSSAEIAQTLSGNARFNDLPDSRASDTAFRTTNVHRLNDRAVREAGEIYDEIFGTQEDDRQQLIRERLAEAFDDYTRSMTLEQITDVNPAAFRFWIASNENEAAIDWTLDSLATLLDRLEGMGLSRQEYLEAEHRILQSIAPSGGLDTAVLRDVIRAGADVGM